MKDHTGHPTEMIKAVKKAEKEFKKSPWTVNIMMGRKFEAERALWFAGRPSHPLISVSAYGADYDFQVSKFGTIHYVQVKWGKNGINSVTARKVIREVASYPYQPGEYLLEANEISMTQERELQAGGGVELPPDIRYP